MFERWCVPPYVSFAPPHNTSGWGKTTLARTHPQINIRNTNRSCGSGRRWRGTCGSPWASSARPSGAWCADTYTYTYTYTRSLVCRCHQKHAGTTRTHIRRCQITPLTPQLHFSPPSPNNKTPKKTATASSASWAPSCAPSCSGASPFCSSSLSTSSRLVILTYIHIYIYIVHTYV